MLDEEGKDFERPGRLFFPAGFSTDKEGELLDCETTRSVYGFSVTVPDTSAESMPRMNTTHSSASSTSSTSMLA